MCSGQTFIFQADNNCADTIKRKSGSAVKIIRVKNKDTFIVAFDNGETCTVFADELKAVA